MYIDNERNIQERLIKFVHCDSGTSGDAHANKIVSCITDELNVDIKDCRRQCY